VEGKLRVDRSVGKKIVLVVDDNEVLAHTIKGMLDTEPELQAVAVTDATRALELARSVQINVILLDYLMPGINGWDLFQMLQEDEKTKHIPVIFVTGQNGSFLKDQPGIAGYVAKPFGIDEIVGPVKRLCREM
jgi:CheY-like chemotaxis protein